MATSKVSIRLSEGFYHAVKDISEALGTDISTTAGVLVMFGMSYMPEKVYKEETAALIAADAMEAYAQMLRTLAKMPKSERERAWKNLTEGLERVRNLTAHMQVK